MRKQIVAGNWKMNTTLPEGLALAKGIDEALRGKTVHCDVILGTPFTHLASVAAAIDTTRIGVAAENCADKEKGAFTGEVSAAMIASTGARYVIIGHSERSLYFGEKNEIQRRKMENVLNVGLIPLLCVGESLEEREAGKEHEVIAHQLSVLHGLNTKNIAVAYEPVWAIGTGKVATVEQIADMHAFIYKEILSLCGSDVKIRVLYGGSVKADNAADIFAVPHVDGALVGGASLSYDSFTAIINAAQAS